MADITETIGPLGEDHPKGHRQTMLPNPMTGSFVADDTDNHDFRFKGVGKGRMTIGLDNPSNKTVTWALYGSFDKDGEVGDVALFPITTGQTLATATKVYETNNDPFPFYLFRATVAAGGDSTTISLFIYLSAF
ncbi:MAG: hypothetical protein V3U60_06945 [Gammaproteobacteria bacterium]